MPEQLSEMTFLCTNAGTESLSQVVSCVAYHTLLEASPRAHQHFTYWLPIQFSVSVESFIDKMTLLLLLVIAKFATYQLRRYQKHSQLF